MNLFMRTHSSNNIGIQSHHLYVFFTIYVRIKLQRNMHSRQLLAKLVFPISGAFAAFLCRNVLIFLNSDHTSKILVPSCDRIQGASSHPPQRTYALSIAFSKQQATVLALKGAPVNKVNQAIDSTQQIVLHWIALPCLGKFVLRRKMACEIDFNIIKRFCKKKKKFQQFS